MKLPSNTPLAHAHSQPFVKACVAAALVATAPLQGLPAVASIAEEAPTAIVAPAPERLNTAVLRRGRSRHGHIRRRGLPKTFQNLGGKERRQRSRPRR